MAKKRSGESKSKVANGVGKGKKEAKPESEDMDQNEVEETAVADEASVSTSDPPKRVSSKKGKKRVASAPRAGTSGRSGERVRKAPERFEAITAQKKGKKKGGKSGGEYAVQAIRGVRKVGSKWEYLVKWEGYPESENNWEPQSNLQNCPEHLKKFIDEAKVYTDGILTR